MFNFLFVYVSAMLFIRKYIFFLNLFIN